jgi:hypothetical protein
MSANRIPLRRDTRVFISAVSRELGTVHKLVKKALEDSGYHAVEQDNFPLDYRELVDKLQNQIVTCDAVIHIAGRYFGAEPRQRPEGAPRRSYTQLEYDLARKLGKPVYVFVTGAGFPTDPYEAEDEEKVHLQEAYRQALMGTDQEYHCAVSREDIDQKVRSLQFRVEALVDELTRTDEKIVDTGTRLGRRLAVIFTVVLAVLATVGYLAWQGEKQRKEKTSRPTRRGAGRWQSFQHWLGCHPSDSESHRRENLRPAKGYLAVPAGTRQGRAGRG